MLDKNNFTGYKAGIYARLSQKEIITIDKNNSITIQEDEQVSESIDNQLSLLKRFCKENKISIYDEYVDDGFTGGNFDRPAFQRMIKDIENKKINLVIVKDLSRLARTIKVTDFIEVYAREHGVRIIAIQDKIDNWIDNEMADNAQLEAFCNEWYLRDTSKKVRAIKRLNVMQGKVCLTYTPYGYKKDPEDKYKLLIDDEVAPIIKKIFNMCKEGKTNTEIAKELNISKIKTPVQVVGNKKIHPGRLKNKWDAETVRRTLTNEIYIGTFVTGKNIKVSYKSKKSIPVMKNDWNRIENHHAPIIDKKTFDEVQKIVFERRFIKKRNNNWMFSKLIQCDGCGCYFYPEFVWKKDNTYNRFHLKCNTIIREKCASHYIKNGNEIIDLILSKIKKSCTNFLNKIDVEKQIDKIQKEEMNKGYANLISQLNKEKQVIKYRTDKLYESRLNENISIEEFERQYQKLKNKENDIDYKINTLDKKYISNNQKKQLEKIANEFMCNEKISREMLEKLIEKIIITKDNQIKIYYKFKNLN